MASITPELQAQFDTAVERVKNEKRSDGKVSTNDEKLQIYSLFKQATQGDVVGSQPWAVQIEARAKWDAWNNLKGMNKADAMAEYVKVVEQQLGPKQ